MLLLSPGELDIDFLLLRQPIAVLDNMKPVLGTLFCPGHTGQNGVPLVCKPVSLAQLFL